MLLLICRLGLGQVVSKAFRDARSAANRYTGLRVIAAFAAAFDAAAYRSQPRDLSQFRKDMALLRCALALAVHACLCMCS
jgi:dynein heavy chain